MFMLKVEGLAVTYDGRTVLDGLDLDLRKGGKCVIVGPNGSGKTTFFRSLLGLAAPSAGEIRFNGVPIPDSGNTGISGNLPECYRLLPLSCRDLASMYCEIKMCNRDRLMDLVERFSLKSALNRKSYNLSTGEQKIFFNLMSIVCDSELVVLDEPFENVDFERKGLLIELISSLQSSVILSTHDAGVLEYLGGWRLFVLLAGRLFGPLDPTLWSGYYFSLGKVGGSQLDGILHNRAFSITLDHGEIPLSSFEKVDAALRGRP